MKIITWAFNDATRPGAIPLAWMKSAIEAAIIKWERELSGTVAFIEGTGGSQHFDFTFNGTGFPKYVGWTSGIGKKTVTISLDAACKYRWRWWQLFTPFDAEACVVLTHEIGHALGCVHSASEASTMHANPSTTRIDSADSWQARTIARGFALLLMLSLVGCQGVRRLDDLGDNRADMDYIRAVLNERIGDPHTALPARKN